MRDNLSKPRAAVTPSHRTEEKVVAFHLAAALEAYEASIERLIGGGDELEQYALLTRQFHQMRLYALSLPQMSVPWVRVMISRFELGHTVSKHQRLQSPDVWETAHEAHKGAITALHERCIRFISA